MPIHTINLQYVAVIKDSQITDKTPLEIYSQITCYYITQRGYVVHCPASVMLLGGGKENANCHVNILIIVNPQKTWHYLETWCLFLL